MVSQTRKRMLNLAGLTLLGGLAGFLVFWQLGRRDEAVAEKEAEDKVFAIADLQAIDSVTLSTAAGELRLEREAGERGAWRIAEPVATLAEQTTVDALVRQVGTVKRLRPVGEKQPDGTIVPPTELWMFGLAPPRLTVTLTERTGAEHQLLVGKRNNFDGAIYVKRADQPDLALVEGGFEYQVNKDLYQLRDKRLVTFSEEAIQGVQVTPVEPTQGYRLVRDGEGFRLTAPIAAPADEAQVKGLLSALVNVRAKTFVHEAADAEVLARYGLRPAAATLVIELGDGGRQSAAFGRQQVGETTFYYASLGEGRPLLELSSDWLVKKLVVDAEAMRDKRVVVFPREQVAGMRIRRGETTLVLTKSRDLEQPRDVWQITAPESGPADAATITGLLYRLQNLRAERIVVEKATDAQLAEHALTQPEVVLELVDEQEAVLAGLSFGKGPLNEWYAVAKGQRRIDLVEPSLVNDLSVDPADYQAPPVDTE